MSLLTRRDALIVGATIALGQAACRTETSGPTQVKGTSVMPVVRISKGGFEPTNVVDAERLLKESERALRGALTQLPGLLHYYVGIDRERGSLTNVSVWDSLEHAHQMDTLPEMIAQRPILEAAGVAFEVITNHDTIWTITP
jgi:hypothetical protein